MIVVMTHGASEEQILRVEKRLTEMGYRTHPIFGQERTVIGAVGRTEAVGSESILNLPGVEKVVPILKPYKLVSREMFRSGTQVKIKDSFVGGKQLLVIAGPCVVEEEDQMLSVAIKAREAGCRCLRGGAFKPRTSPYSFQGLGEEGLGMLSRAGSAVGLPVVSEVMDTRDVELVARHVDVLQIGARNMQNFTLLREVGLCQKPVLLKRGLSATVEEWLMAAEYIMDAGNPQIILCERGIRTYENGTRNTLDISAVVQVKMNSHLPVIVDPSHGTGVSLMVGPMARAAVAAGADGVMVEVHPDPVRAKCDGQQSLNLKELGSLMRDLRSVALAVGRDLPGESEQLRGDTSVSPY